MQRISVKLVCMCERVGKSVHIRMRVVFIMRRTRRQKLHHLVACKTWEWKEKIANIFN